MVWVIPRQAKDIAAAGRHYSEGLTEQYRLRTTNGIVALKSRNTDCEILPNVSRIPDDRDECPHIPRCAIW